jgi:hypothetical protein
MNASSRKNVSNPATSPTSAKERAQWLERFRRSGLSQESFARTHGVKLSRLRYWLYHPRRSQGAIGPAPRWQEIPLSSWPTAVTWGAEIRWADGCTVRLQAELARELVAPFLARRR